MCGILGIAADSRNDLPSMERLESASELLRHRGPDGSGTYFSPLGPAPHAALGHRRLSIIDLDSGQQPMSNEDGTVWITFNGEIYNFRELRQELEHAGHTFKTGSDTEAILHTYETYGEDCVRRLRGMFSFGLWDDRHKRLLLARDRLGQKPLYYSHQNGALAFSSQPKSIFVLNGMERRLNPQSLDAYLAYQYVPHPLSIYEGIWKLPPAHYLVYEQGEVRTERYWQLQFTSDDKMNEAEACARIRQTLKESVRLRLVSDVPLGAFLSGGIDSTIIVGLMSEITEHPVETFTIGFEESDFNEVEFARLAAKRFRTSHHEQIVRPKAIEVLPLLAEHHDEPFGDSSSIPTYYLSKMTREHVTVALTGDAGDECFAGYRRYKAVKLAGLLDRLPAPLRKLLDPGKLPGGALERGFMQRLKKFTSGIPLPPEERYFLWMSIFAENERRELYTPEFLKKVSTGSPFRFMDQYYEEAGDTDLISATTYVDLCSYLPCDLLTKVDIASMANSLEARSPFLDPAVVELAASLPMELKLRGMKDKYLLKTAFADLIPESILNRDKMGFGVPLAPWFRGELKDFLQDHLLNGRGIGEGYFRTEAVQQKLDEHMDGHRDHGHQLYALLMFELWNQMVRLTD